MAEEKRCNGCKDEEHQCVGCWSYDMKRKHPDNPKAWND